MSEFQTLLALVVLIYVLCVIVQGLQELVKSALNTKAKTMEATIKKFMGNLLTNNQVQHALDERGLDITALEHYNRADFRSLLDGVQFTASQIQEIPKIVASADATVDELKDHAAAAYDAARAKFEQSYATANKWWVLALSVVVVVVLNANLIKIYEQLESDQVIAQAIVGSASKVTSPVVKPGSELGQLYETTQTDIKGRLQQYPIIVRWGQWKPDWGTTVADKFYTFFGLALMIVLVSLGAPFWNDVLKGMTGVNNALNTGGKKT
jgi:hypothetical protein